MNLVIEWKDGEKTHLWDLTNWEADQIEDVYAAKRGVVAIKRTDG